MSYKKIILMIASVAVISAPIAAMADDAPATVSADSSASISAPATSAADSSAGGSAPATSAADSSAGGSAPATVDSGSSAGGSAPSTVGAGSSAGTGSSSNGGSSPVSNGGGSSSSGSSGSVYLGAYSTIVGGATTTCPLIGSYMKLGGSNNSADVTKLQAFLKNAEGANVSVTGIFDAKTEAAVEAFQAKYLSDILGPWGATKASGMVYITTLKKINQLACSQPLSLSASELAVINNYKANSASVSVSAPAAPATSSVGPVMSTSTDSFNGAVGSSVDANSNTAAAGNTSIMGKFWSFLKNLF